MKKLFLAAAALLVAFSAPLKVAAETPSISGNPIKIVDKDEFDEKSETPMVVVIPAAECDNAETKKIDAAVAGKVGQAGADAMKGVGYELPSSITVAADTVYVVYDIYANEAAKKAIAQDSTSLNFTVATGVTGKPHAQAVHFGLDPVTKDVLGAKADSSTGNVDITYTAKTFSPIVVLLDGAGSSEGGSGSSTPDTRDSNGLVWGGVLGAAVLVGAAAAILRKKESAE